MKLPRNHGEGYEFFTLIHPLSQIRRRYRRVLDLDGNCERNETLYFATEKELVVFLPNSMADFCAGIKKLIVDFMMDIELAA